MIKKILLAIIIAALITGSYGCMGKYKDSDDRALEYLEQKYGEKFEYDSTFGTGTVFSTPDKRKIFVTCKSLPEKRILVAISGKGKKETYSDNYMEYFYEKKTADYLSKAAEEYLKDITVESNFPAFPSEEGIVPETSFEDYILLTTVSVIISVNDSDSDKDKVFEFVNALKRQGVHFELDIKIINTNEAYLAYYFKGYDDVNFSQIGGSTPSGQKLE